MLAEQLDQVRIGAVVVNDEAGIHSERPAARFHRDRMRVTAQAGFALEQKHVMLAAEVVRRGKTGDS
jgi:hypothetical protein